MYIKNIIASTIALAFLVSSVPVWAGGGHLQLSETPGSNYYSNNEMQGTASDDISLRGHLTMIPKGTIMMVKLDQPLSSYGSKTGDSVSAVVESDVYVENQVAIPAGSVVEGAVSGVTPAQHLGKSGSIEIQFQTVRTPNGYVMPLRGHVVTSDSSGVIRGDSQQAQVLKTLGTAAGGTAAGTLLGTAAGSILGSAGNGAAFGLAAGAIAGIGYAIARQGKQVVIPSGARLSIVLDQPIAVN